MKHAMRTLALLIAAALFFVGCSEKEVSDQYTIIVSANNADWGTVYGGGKYEAGSEIQISATPAVGYKFVRWNDNNTTNPRTVKVTGDAAYMAIFEDVNNPDNPTPGPGGDTIPHDPNTHAYVTFGDTTWNGLTIIKQSSADYTQLTLMSDENGEGPSVTWCFPDTNGTFSYSPDNVISVYYMDNFQDYVTVNGRQYPHWLCVSEATLNITDYNLSAGYVTGTITARLLNMEREAQGLSQEFREVSVDVEKMYFISYSK